MMPWSGINRYEASFVLARLTIHHYWRAQASFSTFQIIQRHRMEKYFRCSIRNVQLPWYPGLLIIPAWASAILANILFMHSAYSRQFVLGLVGSATIMRFFLLLFSSGMYGRIPRISRYHFVPFPCSRSPKFRFKRFAYAKHRLFKAALSHTHTSARTDRYKRDTRAISNIQLLIISNMCTSCREELSSFSFLLLLQHKCEIYYVYVL